MSGFGRRIFQYLCSNPLNAIALGEAQTVLLGVDVERTKRLAIVVCALAVGPPPEPSVLSA